MKKQTNNAGQNKIYLQALKKSEARFRSIVLWSLDAIIVTDAKGKMEYMNPAAEGVFNRKLESFIGKDFGLPLVNGDSAEIDIFRPGKDQGVGDMHVVETEWLGKKAHLIMIRDITERKRAEEALHLANAYNRSLIEASLDPLVTIGPNGKIMDVNNATEAATGYSRQELIGRDFSDYFTEPEKARAGYEQVFSQGIVKDYPLTIRHASGRLTDVLYNAIVYKNEAGEVQGVFAAARDITERRKMQEELRKWSEELEKKVDERTEELRESKLKFQTIFDSTSSAVMLLTPEKGFFEGNPATVEIFGCKDKSEFIRMSPADLSPEYQPDGKLSTVKAQEMMATAMEKGSHFFEWTHKRVNGEEFFADVMLTRMKWEDRMVLQATVRDITERRKADEASNLLVAIVEGSDDAILSKDLSGHILSWNKAAEHMYGYEAKEILGKHISLLSPPEEKDAYNRIIEQIKRGEKVSHFETERVRKDGSRLWVSLSISPTRDSSGAINGASIIARDITERKKSEDDLRAASLYARNLIEASLDPLVTISSDGKITDVNKTTEQVTGVSRERLVGSDFADYFTEPEKARAGYEQVFSQGVVKDYPLTIRHASGRLTDVLYNASVYKNEAGEVQGVFAAARDITERKKAEEQLKAMAWDLQRKTELLEISNKELEAFSYSVSHDLRAPLRSIDGFSKAILENYSDKLDEQGRNYLCRVCAACQQMAQLVEDMLMLSRINRSGMRRKQVDLSTLAKSIADEFMQNEPQRKVEFVIAPSITVNGDKQLLNIMLHNLLENAWKFTGKHPSARIEFGITKKEETLVYFVADDGAGFDMKYADKLFGAFQRLHTLEEFEGTGIGLAIVQRIVSRHGGKVWAQGEVEKGAIFYFTLV
jgi:PAS domain S-box-containing protein